MEQYTAILTTLIVVLNILLALLSCDVNAQEVKNYTLMFDMQQPILHNNSEEYLSVAIDSSWLQKHKNLPIKNKAFINLARHLSPAYVRVGGTFADRLIFSEHATNVSQIAQNGNTNFTITGQDFIDLYTFTNQTKLRMIFDLNVLMRLPNGSWDNSNARQIIKFAKSHNMNLDWQLGNEPNSYNYTVRKTIAAEQLARDYHSLREILNAYGYKSRMIIGPEVGHVGDKNRRAEKYLTEFLANNLTTIQFLTWHHYYVNGRTAKVNDFLNTTIFDSLQKYIGNVHEILKATNRRNRMWLSETSSAYGGGAPGLSNSYVAGFMWLDKLGLGARWNVGVVVRHALIGGYYALIGSDMTPNTDWWVSVIFKKLVSGKVLQVKVTQRENDPNVRMYAHCTQESALIKGVPAVTFYGMNLATVPAKITLPPMKKDVKIFLYVLTSDSLTSSEIKLNGKTLRLKADGNLPPFEPIIVKPSQAITLPNSSMVFMMVQGLDVPACRITKIKKLP